MAQMSLWHIHCFDCSRWCFISPSVWCAMRLQWPAATSTPVRASDIKSMFRLRVLCFCLFSNQPLSANAITPFIDPSTDYQQPTHIQFSNNAWVNIIFSDYRFSGAVMWGTAEYRPLLRRMHNHSKQCPKGNYGFYTTRSLLFVPIEKFSQECRNTKIIKTYHNSGYSLEKITEGCASQEFLLGICFDTWFHVDLIPKL